MKGTARIRLQNGDVRLAEIHHWYEAHGIGKREFKTISTQLTDSLRSSRHNRSSALSSMQREPRNRRIDADRFATGHAGRSATESGGTSVMKLISLNVGLPRTLGRPDARDAMDKVWTTGFFKEPIAGPVWLGRTNLAGDGQADLQFHGGPEKAVNVYPEEHYAYWQVALGIAKLTAGAFGENFTTGGALEGDVCIGDVFQVGDALVQLSQPRQPCWKLARRWRVKDLAVQVQQSGRTGWYFRVLREGAVEVGAGLRLVERTHPEWSVAAANEVMHHRKDLAAARSLAECPLLSVSWRESLSRRAATGVSASTAARLEGAPE